MKIMKIQRRKLELFMINVPMINRTSRNIYVTKKQIEKLNALPVGKEIFLSRFYCYFGGDFHVVRTSNGLQYVPNPWNQRDDEGLGSFYLV
jgi:hypothetical protein